MAPRNRKSKQPKEEQEVADVWDDLDESADLVDSENSASMEVPSEPEQNQEVDDSSAPTIPVKANLDKLGKRSHIREIGAETDSGSLAVDPGLPDELLQKAKVGTQTELRKRRRKLSGKDESADWGEAKKVGFSVWMLLAAVVCILFVVAALFASRKLGSKGIRKAQEKSMTQFVPADEITILTDDSLEESDRKIQTLLDSRSEVSEIYGTFVTAQTPEEFLEFIWNRDEVEPIIRKVFEVNSDVPSDWMPSDLSQWQVGDDLGFIYGRLEGESPDFSAFLAFFRFEGEQLKMDWKGSVQYCSSSFETLTRGEGDGSEIRCVLSFADFYSLAFPDTEYQAFRIASPRKDHVIWGYVRRDSDFFLEIAKEFETSKITGVTKTEIPMTLELAKPSGESLPNQWVIKSIKSLSWLDTKNDD